jgi:hypothetical protein
MIIVILHISIYRWVDRPNFFFAPVGLLPQKGKAVKKGQEYPPHHHHHYHWELSFTYLLVMLLRE